MVVSRCVRKSLLGFCDQEPAGAPVAFGSISIALDSGSERVLALLVAISSVLFRDGSS